MPLHLALALVSWLVPLALRAADATASPMEAITGAWVLPVSGPEIPRGAVLFQGGKIVAVGSELSIPPGTRVHAADGKYVCPGFVAVEASGIGVAGGQGDYRDNLDPYRRDLKIAIASGITCIHVVESGPGSLFGGEYPLPGGATAVIKPTVGDLGGMLLKEPAALYLSLRSTPLAVFELRSRFRRAAEHLRQVAEAEKAKAQPPQAPEDLDRTIRVLKGDLPTIVVADSVEEVRTILATHREHPFPLVLKGAPGAWQLGAELAGRRIAVITKARGPDFNFNMDEPAVPEDGIIPIRVPWAFAQAGVPIAIQPYRRSISLDGIAGRDLTALAMDAAYAVKGGLDEAAALRAITLEPARILRIADRVGSLEPGKDADILILSRHPLDYRAFVETAFINGKVYYERAKSPLYREIPLR